MAVVRFALKINAIYENRLTPIICNTTCHVWSHKELLSWRILYLNILPVRFSSQTILRYQRDSIFRTKRQVCLVVLLFLSSSFCASAMHWVCLSGIKCGFITTQPGNLRAPHPFRPFFVVAILSASFSRLSLHNFQKFRQIINDNMVIIDVSLFTWQRARPFGTIILTAKRKLHLMDSFLFGPWNRTGRAACTSHRI